MKLHGIWFGLLLVCLGCQPSKTSALTSSADAILGLMNDRLALMADVAEAKSYLNLPIEDSVREESILQAVEVDAKAAGIDKAFAREFFTAQFEAAKILQTTAKKQLPALKPTEEGMQKAGEKLNDLRTKINDINIKLLTALGKIEWNTQDAEARKIFAERGPGQLKAHGEAVGKALSPLMPR